MLSKKTLFDYMPCQITQLCILNFWYDLDCTQRLSAADRMEGETMLIICLN